MFVFFLIHIISPLKALGLCFIDPEKKKDNDDLGEAGTQNVHLEETLLSNFSSMLSILPAFPLNNNNKTFYYRDKAFIRRGS